MAGLSKSRITAFEQCPKKLWLSVHRPDLAEYSGAAEARFATGNAGMPSSKDRLERLGTARGGDGGIREYLANR